VLSNPWPANQLDQANLIPITNQNFQVHNSAQFSFFSQNNSPSPTVCKLRWERRKVGEKTDGHRVHIISQKGRELCHKIYMIKYARQVWLNTSGLADHARVSVLYYSNLHSKHQTGNHFKPHSACNRTVFFLNFRLQLCVVKQIVGVVCPNRVWFKYNITLSGVV